jgi:hypothetical protein
MTDRTCNICGKKYKYPNLLKRHMATLSCYVSTINEIIEPSHNIIKEEIKCSKCIFTTIHRASYSRHKKKCIGNTIKESDNTLTSIIVELKDQIAYLVSQHQPQQQPQPQPQIKNTNITKVSGNITGNTIIQGDMIHNTIINLTNPFGYESLSNISLEKLPSIFINIDEITERLCDIIYENPENKNYFKVNITRPDITVFTYDLKLKSIQEGRFIKDFFINIVFNYFIRIIHEYKNKLSIEDFSSYMRQAIVYEKIARNIDIDDPNDHVHIDIIKSYINDFSRNKEVQAKIKDTISLITKEGIIKHNLLRKIDELKIPNILNEYKIKNTNLTLEDKKTSRNLNYYKKKLSAELLKEQNPGKTFD